MATLQVQDVYDIYSRQKQDISDVDTDVFLDWCDWLNKFAYRHILGIDPERFIEETTITAVANQEYASLPADFRDIQRFGCGLYEYTDSVRTDTQYPITNPNSGITGFYIKNDRLYFTPTPTESHTYMLRYVPGEPEIDALTDYFITPLDARYIKYILGAIDVFYNQWDDNPGAEGIADARFVRLLNELSRNVKQQPAVYSLDDPSLNF